MKELISLIGGVSVFFEAERGLLKVLFRYSLRMVGGGRLVYRNLKTVLPENEILLGNKCSVWGNLNISSSGIFYLEEGERNQVEI